MNKKALILITILIACSVAFAASTNPGHPASQVGGTSAADNTFADKIFSFINNVIFGKNVEIGGNLTVNESIALGGVSRSSWPVGTIDTNCSADGSCPLVTYDSETTAWDKNASDDITTANIADQNVNSSNYWDGYDAPSGWDLDASNDVITTTNFGGEVSGTYNSIALSDTALDDQYIKRDGDTVGSYNYTFDTNTFAIDSVNHRIGIGTTTPSQTLDVNGSALISNTLYVDNTTTNGERIVISADSISATRYRSSLANGNGLWIAKAYGTETTPGEAVNGYGGSFGIVSESAWNSTDFPSYFSISLWGSGTNTTEKMRLTSTGSLGIGTISPAAKLQLNGSGNIGMIITSTTDNATLRMDNAGGSDYLITSGNGKLFINEDADALGTGLTVDNTGRVGIGTASPDGKLTIFSGLGSGIYLKDTNNSSRAEIYIDGTGDARLYLYNSSNASRIMLSTDSDASSYILGNVGIGTIAPSHPLQVNGGIAARGTTLTNGYVSLQPGDASNVGYVEWYKPGTPTRIGYMGYGAGTNLALNLESSATYSVMGGNVGIGTTAINQRLQVNGTVNATAFVGDGSGLTSINASNIASGTLAFARLPALANTHTHDAANITSGTLALSVGGTGASLTGNSGGIIYSNGASAFAVGPTASGANYVLISTVMNNPGWTAQSNLNAGQVDGYDFDQDVRTTGTPTFSNLSVTNLSVSGSVKFSSLEQLSGAGGAKTCSSGKKAIGGGCSSSSADCVIYGSYPSSSAWNCQITNRTGGGGCSPATYLTTFVVCI